MLSREQNTLFWSSENPGLYSWVTIFILGFLLTIYASAYTYGMVVGTLTAVESPHENNDKLSIPEVYLSIRLGYTWRFRGLTMALLIRGVKIALFQIPDKDSTTFYGWFFYNIAIDLILSNLYIAMIHIIISQPSSRSFNQWVTSWTGWIQVAPSAALWSIARSANFFVPLGLLKYFGSGSTIPEWAQLFALIASSAILYFLFTVPTQAIFIRIAASILPESCSSIVTLDRRLSEKHHYLRVLAAWTSWDGASRLRYFKVMGKTFLLKMVAWFYLSWLAVSVYEPYTREAIWVFA